MYKLIIFDLDNTLTKSKETIDEEMSELFFKLLKEKKVAVISGGSMAQMEKELIFLLKIDSNFSNLHIFPTDGTAYFAWSIKNGKWEMIYQEAMSGKDKIKIIDAFSKVLKEIDFYTKYAREDDWGELIEDRVSSITFSALGQNAPLNIKEKWVCDQKKRLEIKKMLEKVIPEFEIGVAGTTSIDVTAKGQNKAYGIEKMVEYLKVPKNEMIFIGDSLFAGGNDNPVINTGVNAISVKNPEETKDLIKKIIGNTL